MTINTSNCVDCARDTSYGAGLFVNRIPADNGKLNGWLCVDCQLETCSLCNTSTLDYVLDDCCDVVCTDCNKNKVEISEVK